MRSSELHPSVIRQMVRSRDIAYLGFGYFGLMFTTAFVLNRIPTGWLIYRWVGAVLSLPVIMAGFVVAALLGIAYTLRAWREWPLVVLAVLTLVMPLMLYGAARSELVQGWLGSAFFSGYTVLAVVLPAWWFLSRRGKLWGKAGLSRVGDDDQGLGAIQDTA